MFEVFSAISSGLIILIGIAFVYYLHLAYKTNNFGVLAHAVVDRYKEKLWAGYDVVAFIGCCVSIYFGFAATALICYLIISSIFVIWAYWYVRNNPIK